MATKHEQCPRCRSLGKDRSEDNLAIYEDGHAHCFSCGYHRPPNLLLRLKSVQLALPAPKAEDSALQFPADFTENIPVRLYDWLSKYDITPYEIRKNRIGWSPSLEAAIFPIFDKNDTIIAWQARDLSDRAKRQKYITYGPIGDILDLRGIWAKTDRIVIVVEDLISAIKVGRIYQTMPTYGCRLPVKAVLKLQERFKRIGIWWDSDKTNEAYMAALRASQFMPSFVVNSPKDPKEYNAQEIHAFIQHSLQYILDKDDDEEDQRLAGDATERLNFIRNQCRTMSYESIKANYPNFPLNYQEYLNYKHPDLAPKNPKYPTDGPESDDSHDPEPGETYIQWCLRLGVPRSEKSYDTFVFKCVQLSNKDPILEDPNIT